MLFDLLTEKPGLGSHLSQHSLLEEKITYKRDLWAPPSGNNLKLICHEEQLFSYFSFCKVFKLWSQTYLKSQNQI